MRPRTAATAASWALASLGALVATPARAQPPAPAPPAPRPEPPPTYPLAGRLVLTEQGAPATEKSIARADGAVWFEPDADATPPKPQSAQMVTVRKQFTPQLLVVPVGSTVAFPNQDPILHNVFSVSGRNKFDLGLVGAGKGKSVVLREPGLVRVFCNVHHAMFANVLVVATPHFARLGQDGAFRLEGLPGGAGKLHYWHARGEPGSRPVRLPHAAELTLELPVTVARLPAHKNKFGKSYGRSAYD